jgi:heterodisulfide reductase subunit C
MTATKFGFSDAVSRNMDLNSSVPDAVQTLFRQEPTLKNCIGCGNCAAMCTSGQFIDMQFYRLNLLLKRGIINEIKQKAQNCMLCGKCQLTCPRGVNIRHGVLLMSAM